MQDSDARKSTGMRASHELFKNVACPFCGMLCDDLEVERNDGALKVLKNGCGRSVAGFERKLPPSSPKVRGKEVTLAEAVKEAAALIKQANNPLFGGLGTDVEGMRAAMALAERAGGVVDHALSEGQYRNIRVLQSTGWITSTLTETRNRADLIIVVGSDMRKLHPRFFERIVSPPDSMFGVTAPKRTVVLIGEVPDRKVAAGAKVGEVITLPCKVEQVGEVLGALRARLRGFRINAKTAGGIAIAKIDALMERCREAQYGVVVWAPPTIDVPHAELTVEQVAGLVKDLNVTQRFAGLSLGGNEGAMSAGSVSTWQSGFPLRISYASGAPQFDPYRNSISRMVTEGEGDLLMWIASISPDLGPPSTDIPTIVLGTPGLRLPQEPAVFIPVGTPGVDEKGRLVRCDSVVSLPLKNLHRAELPHVADVLKSIEAAL
jgi:formylmethanofuran dehydrogenase subunit B